jgi:hypothetical protein
MAIRMHQLKKLNKTNKKNMINFTYGTKPQKLIEMTLFSKVLCQNEVVNLNVRQTFCISRHDGGSEKVKLLKKT